jgi:hypothetical protein
VPYRTYLHGAQVVELVAAVRGGGQAEPAVCRDRLDRVLERGGRDLVAFVGDDQAVPGDQFRDVVSAGQGLQGDDVDGAAELGPAAAELPGFDAEVNRGIARAETAKPPTSAYLALTAFGSATALRSADSTDVTISFSRGQTQMTVARGLCQPGLHHSIDFISAGLRVLAAHPLTV